MIIHVCEQLKVHNMLTLSDTAECFLAVVTDCVQVGRVRPGEDVYKIQNVNFYSLATSLYDDLDSTYNKDSWDSDDDTQSNILQHPCVQLQKLFANGSFYFTPDFDLTRTVQARYGFKQ